MGRNTKVKAILTRKPMGAQDAMDRLMKLSKNKVWLKKLERGDAGAQKLYADLMRLAATDDRGFALPAPAPTGKKLDSGKSPVTRGVLWYFPRALLAVADVSAYGAKKYELALEDKNWMNVPDGFGRYSDAQGRHLIKQAINPQDKESELRHAQMDAWNALAKLELILVEEEKAGKVSYD